MEDEIKNADVAILAVDIQTTGNDRFKDLPTIKVPTSVVVKAPKQLLEEVEVKLRSKK